MISADYHVHTNYCDGKSRAEETVKRAIDLGFSEIGFSGHGYTFCGEDYCMPEKECVGSGDDDPCELFRRIKFPVDEFFPPDAVCGCADRC